MRRLVESLIVAAAAVLAAPAGAAGAVYRCGNEYTQLPCASGRLVDASDDTTASQRAEARDNVLREQRLGESMARERRAEAAMLRPAIAASMGPAKAAPAPIVVAKKKSKAKRKSADDTDADFIARMPRSRTATS